jgi:diguanylate cyclase (GGDEF)-like protein/PAS domain S-box-containing protein
MKSMFWQQNPWQKMLLFGVSLGLVMGLKQGAIARGPLGGAAVPERELGDRCAMWVGLGMGATVGVGLLMGFGVGAARLRGVRRAGLLAEMPLEGAAVGLVALDLAGQVLEVNRAAARSLGVAARSLVGHPWANLLGAGDRGGFEARCRALFAAQLETPWAGELGGAATFDGPLRQRLRVPLGDGAVAAAEATGATVRDVPCEVHLALVRDRRGRPSYFLLTLMPLGDRGVAGPPEVGNEQRYRELVNRLREVVFQVDCQGRWRFLSPAWERLLGYRVADSLGRSVADFLHPSHAQAAADCMQELMGEAKPWCRRTLQFVASDGTMRHVEIFAQPERDGTGAIVGIAGSLDDVTERFQTEDALRSSEERLRALFEQAAVGIGQLSRSGHYIQVNNKFCSLVGYSAEEIRAMTFLDLTHPADRDRNRTLAEQLWKGQIPSYSIEKRFVRKNGKVQWVNVTVSLVSHGDRGAESWTLAIVEDISGRKQAEEQLTYSAFYDQLTGLANRNLFVTRLQGALQRVVEGEIFALLYIDLDRFKVVNDSLGHQAGDDLIVQIAQRLQGCVRCNDTVARLGGDEFAVLLEAAVEEAEAIAIAERIQTTLRQPFRIHEHDFYSSASIGVAFSNNPHTGRPYESWEAMMRDADIAMYRAKNGGRARCCVFEGPMHQRTLTQLNLEADLRQAMARQGLDLHFQPIVALADLRLVGFEALLRWEHSQWGPVSPAEFVPVAEETDLIVELGEWVLRAACQQIRAWRASGVLQPEMTVAVNVSGRQFERLDFGDRVGEIVRDASIAAAHLRLEVTETAIAQKHKSTAAILGQLRDTGIRSSIDDFGTGYSSLSRLHRFPVDLLKIDRSFVKRMATSEDGREIARTIINLARSLNLKTVAEGIETAQQLQQLQAMGCDYGQGYFFAPALDPQAATLLLEQGHGAFRETWQRLTIARSPAAPPDPGRRADPE